MGTGKVCCCVQSIGLECPPLWCEPDPCYSEERGICEVNQKMCCMYSEVQFPPGKDIRFCCLRSCAAVLQRGGKLSDQLLDSNCLGSKQFSLGNSQARACVFICWS